MFESLQDKLSTVFKNLTSRGTLSKKDTEEALKQIRVALIEADVALPVVKEFISKISEKAVGIEIIKSVQPGQMVVKIVHDALIEMLGSENCTISLHAPAPVPIMLVGLQGSGKTTTSAKIAAKLQRQQNKKVLLASLDTYRPAAQEQLRQLGEQLSIATLPIIEKQNPLDIAKRALNAATLGGFDVVILDTAGRTHIDDELMDELKQIQKITNPHEILLVADSLTGQDAVNVAASFNKLIQLTGIILTKMDGDSRGGAALSMRAATSVPIKAIGVGEKVDAIEDFFPKRIADRILGMGDIISLVEKAAENLDKEKAEALAKKIQKGKFDFNDLAIQLQQMQKLGGLGAIMGMLPGMAKMKDQVLSAGINDSLIVQQLAIISSMTPQERENPELLKHSRKQRIAKGSGTDASQINKLIKMQRQMADMMKSMGGKSKGGMMQNLFGKFGGGFMGNGLPKNLGNLGDLGNASLPNINGNNDLSELMGKLNNMPNLPGMSKKK